MPPRYAPEVRRLRSALRRIPGFDQLRQLSAELERLPVAALAADNSGQYVAANAIASDLTGYAREELMSISVPMLTPVANRSDFETLWNEFVERGTQHGEYELVRRDRTVIRVRYDAYASVVPGVHVSFLRST